MNSSPTRSDGRLPTRVMSWRQPRGATPDVWPRRYTPALPAMLSWLQATQDSAGGVAVGWPHDRGDTLLAPPNGYTDRRHPPKYRGRSPRLPEAIHIHESD